MIDEYLLMRIFSLTSNVHWIFLKSQPYKLDIFNKTNGSILATILILYITRMKNHEKIFIKYKNFSSCSI